VSTGALFLLVGMLSDRRHTRLIAEFGGLKAVMPRLVAVFMLITLSSIGLPGLNGFVGEFLILLGAFRWDPRFATVAALGVILSAVYMLWMFQRVNYGVVTNEANRALPDLSVRERWVIIPTVVAAVFMGLAPSIFLRPWNRRFTSSSEGEPRRGGRRQPRGKVPGTKYKYLAPRDPMMPFQSLTAIVPILCVVAAAVAAMLAEALREKGERVPAAGLGLVGLAAPRSRLRCSGTATPPASASSSRTTSASSSRWSSRRSAC